MINLKKAETVEEVDFILRDPEIFSRYKDGICTPEDYKILQIPRHALHAIAINFDYYFAQTDNNQESKRYTIISTLPLDFQRWIEQENLINITTLEALIKEKILSYFVEI